MPHSSPRATTVPHTPSFDMGSDSTSSTQVSPVRHETAPLGAPIGGVPPSSSVPASLSLSPMPQVSMHTPNGEFGKYRQLRSLHTLVSPTPHTPYSSSTRFTQCLSASWLV